MYTTHNRFAAIFQQDDEEKPNSPPPPIHAEAKVSSKKQPLGVTTAKNSSGTGGSSSLSRIDALIKFREAEKKRIAEEAEALKRAAEAAAKAAADEAQRKKAEIAAKKNEAKKKFQPTNQDDGFELITRDNRRAHQKINALKQSELHDQQGHDRENRSGKKFSRKKNYTGHKEPINPVVPDILEETISNPVEEVTTMLDITKISPERIEPISSPKPKTSLMTFDEYLSTRVPLVVDMPKRQPNEGSGPNQFERTCPISKSTESYLGISAKRNPDTKNHFSAPSQFSGAFVVDPRLESILSEPTPLKSFKRREKTK